MIRVIIVISLLTIISCKQVNESGDTFYNPAAEGFNEVASDVKAIAIADSVMQAMGGRKAWDETRFISWNFFGRRDLVWDKWTGSIRIEIPADSTIMLLNLNDESGRVQIKGREIQDTDSVKTLLNRAKQIWVNDAYWLVMPFKLKDSGVTLKLIGEDTLPSGNKCKVLELTFEAVGFTPNNKYRVFVDETDNLIKQWAYYQDASQDEPSAIWPWDNYQQYGNILLSADRSDGRGPKNVKVDANLPDEIFTQF